MTPAYTRTRSLVRVQILLGLPLGVYLCLHLWENWPALHDRDAWLASVSGNSSPGWEISLVLLPLALHAILGIVRLRREDGADASRSRFVAPGLRAIQAGTGIAAVSFVVYHMAQVYDFDRGPHFSHAASYDTLLHTLGRPLHLALYVFGVSAVCFHAAHGLLSATVGLGWVTNEQAFKRLRYVCGALGFLGWFLYLQLLARFAIGTTLM